MSHVNWKDSLTEAKHDRNESCIWYATEGSKSYTKGLGNIEHEVFRTKGIEVSSFEEFQFDVLSPHTNNNQLDDFINH